MSKYLSRWFLKENCILDLDLNSNSTPLFHSSSEYGVQGDLASNPRSVVKAVHHCTGYLTSLCVKCKIWRNHLPGQLWKVNKLRDVLCLANRGAAWVSGLRLAECRRQSLLSSDHCSLQPFSHKLLWFPTCSRNSWSPGLLSSPPPTISSSLGPKLSVEGPNKVWWVRSQRQVLGKGPANCPGLPMVRGAWVCFMDPWSPGPYILGGGTGRQNLGLPGGTTF